MTALTKKLDEMVARAERGPSAPIYQRSGNTTFPAGTPPLCQTCATAAQKPNARAIEDLLCFFADEGEPRFWDFENIGEYYAHAHPAVFTALCRVAGAASMVRSGVIDRYLPGQTMLDEALSALSEALGVENNDET